MNRPASNSIALQKQNEETAIKKMEKANAKLQIIRKQCDEAKNERNKLQIELESLKLRESALNELICTKKEKETMLKTESEEIAKKLEDISWKRKIIAVKREMEKSSRVYYENIMESSRNTVADYVNIDEYKNKLEYENKLKNLRSRVDELKNAIKEKRKLADEYEKSYLEAQMSQKMDADKLKSTEKSLENIENLIRKQEEELKMLLN